MCNKCEDKKIAAAYNGFRSSIDCALDIYQYDFYEEKVEIGVYKKYLMEDHSAEMMAEKLAAYKLAGYRL